MKLEVLVFKPTGKYYTTAYIDVPSDIQIYDIPEQVTIFSNMHKVLMLTEFTNGYPMMVPAKE